MYKEAHKHSSHHREEIEASKECACFQCLSRFKPSDIEIWLDVVDTALCPVCSVDSVIGDASGIDLTDEFLKGMQKYWF